MRKLVARVCINIKQDYQFRRVQISNKIEIEKKQNLQFIAYSAIRTIVCPMRSMLYKNGEEKKKINRKWKTHREWKQIDWITSVCFSSQHHTKPRFVRFICWTKSPIGIKETADIVLEFTTIEMILSFATSENDKTRWKIHNRGTHISYMCMSLFFLFLILATSEQTAKIFSQIINVLLNSKIGYKNNSVDVGLLRK